MWWTQLFIDDDDDDDDNVDGDVDNVMSMVMMVMLMIMMMSMLIEGWTVELGDSLWYLCAGDVSVIRVLKLN